MTDIEYLREQLRKTQLARDRCLRFTLRKTDAHPVVYAAQLTYQFQKLKEAYDMAKRAAKVPAALSEKAQWVGFANVRLDEEQREAYAAWDITPAEVWEKFTEMLSTGYKITVSHQPKKNSFTCAATCENAADPNAGMTMSSYAGTWGDAVKVMLFKHFEVTKGTWGAVEARTSSPFG